MIYTYTGNVFLKICPMWTSFRYKLLLLESNNVQYGNRYYLVICREIMLDKVDKIILAQLGKMPDYHHCCNTNSYSSC